jgi:hypothetical protein
MVVRVVRVVAALSGSLIYAACGGGDDASKLMAPSMSAGATAGVGTSGSAGASGMVARAGTGGGSTTNAQAGRGGGGAAPASGGSGAGASGMIAGAGAGGGVSGAMATGGAGAGGTTAEPDGQGPTVESATAEGPYKVDSYTDGYRDGPYYADSTIYHPADAKPPFPAVAVVPGYVSPQSSIQGWGPFLASHGIVTMTIGTNTPLDYPPARRDALLDALETLKSENMRSGGPLSGKIDLSRLGVMGWSMGGGGSLLAANEHPELKAAISMCGWNPGYWYSDNKVPSLMFASLGDPLAGGQSQGFYSSMPDDTPKMLFEWGAADHFMANDPTGADRQVGRYGLSWMMVYLVGDMRYKQFLEMMPSGTTDFQSDLN